MKLKIINTTDGQYVGHEFVISTDKFTQVVMPDGVVIQITFVMPLEIGFRLGNSNFIIDTQEV